MKKNLMATMIALSLSTTLWADDTVLITKPEIAAADMQMLFEHEAQASYVVALSADEMQETQGAWNRFAAAVIAAPVVVAGAVAMMTGVGEVAIGGAAVAAAVEAAEGTALLDAAAGAAVAAVPTGAGRVAGGLAARRGVAALVANTAPRIGMQIVTPAPRLPINPWANFNWNNWRLGGLARYARWGGA